MRTTFFLAFIFLVTICWHSAPVWAEPLSAPEGKDVETISGEDKDWEEEWEDEDEGAETITVKDPLQSYNRAFFTFNDKAYYYVIKPIYKGYNAVIPLQVQTCIRKFFTNIKTPVRLFNCLFQGKFEGASEEMVRLVVNSTVGVGGLFDPAKSQFNLNIQYEDFGQTLAVHGMDSGIFIEWPILGPATVRDTIGYVGDLALNPLTFVSYVFDAMTSVGVNTGDQINEYALDRGKTYEDITKPAIDPYIAIQDAYMQNRAKKIKE